MSERHDSRTCARCAVLRHPSMVSVRKAVQAAMPGPRKGGAAA